MIEKVFPEGLKVVAEHTVRLPTYMNVSKKTRKALNLNIYRNLHHHSLSNQKQNFHEEVKKLLGGISKAQKIWIHYQVFAPTRGRLDTMNVGSIVDKYFSDTLVEAKIIEDDDYEHVVFNSFSFGGVCKMDGHVIATIFILEKEKPMRVLLDQDDIQSALTAHVETMGIPGATGVELSVDGDDIVAEVTFGESEDTPTSKKTTRKRRSPAKPKATKPEPEAEEVNDEPTETAGEGGGDSADTAEAERTEDSPEDGEKTPTSKGSAKKGNLFGDEENPSSESADKTTDGSAEEKTPDVDSEEVKPKRQTKSSIFDVG